MSAKGFDVLVSVAAVTAAVRNLVCATMSVRTRHLASGFPLTSLPCAKIPVHLKSTGRTGFLNLPWACSAGELCICMLQFTCVLALPCASLKKEDRKQCEGCHSLGMWPSSPAPVQAKRLRYCTLRAGSACLQWDVQDSSCAFTVKT